MSGSTQAEPALDGNAREPLTIASALHSGAHVHLVGIGGSGLSAIARVLLERGYRVSGSDLAPGANCAALVALGATIHTGHSAPQVAGADLVLVSSAIPAANVEVEEARRRGMPVVKRPEFLGWLTAERETIAIAGTHGKTTTTAMIAWVLVKAGRDPSYIVGGTLPQLQRNARAGKGPHFVIEADEYDRTFLGLCPTIGVVTTVEWDHVDCYPTPKDCVDAFHDFAALIPEDGLLVACAEDPIAAGIGETRKARGAPVTSYGLATGVDWQARRVRANGLGGSDYAAWRGGRSQGTVSLRIPGRHNVLNSLAALAVAEELGISFDVAAGALSEVSGVERRFQEKGTSWAITVVDDYAHHPTEIRATLSAARQRYPGRAIWAVFQPHTYSRTRALLEEFAVSFVDADHVIVTDIFAAREQDSLGTSAAEVANRMTHNDVQHIGGLKEAAVTLLERMRPGDVLITLGAGDGYRVGEWVLAGLRARRDDQSAASGTA